MIKRMELENFTVFRQLNVDFSPKINVIIGENGTGKTHLMKAAHVLCKTPGLLQEKLSAEEKKEAEKQITDDLVQTFLPMQNKLGKLRHSGARNGAVLKMIFGADDKIKINFHSNSNSIGLPKILESELCNKGSVFVPTKEVLSFMLGFNSLYKKYELSFDKTHQELCESLDLPSVRPEELHKKSKWIIDEIKKTCGGEFIFYGGGMVTFKSQGQEYSANNSAEGFRKLGTIARLLQTGTIQPGISGPLFWDEPESNLNPALLKLVVKILLEMSGDGQQIIITTHDYVLLKWLNLLVDKTQGDEIFYHVLSRDSATKEIIINSTDDYYLIKDSPIFAAYAELYDADMKIALGEK